MRRLNDKRSRLVEGAAQLFLEQGINTTTLANIAELAKVPLGNVYYYFKSKESIIVAVVEHRLKVLQQIFAELDSDSNANAKQKITSLIKKLLIENNDLIKFGDSVGSLCLELSKQNNDLHKLAIQLMQTLITWCEQQLKTIVQSELAATKLAKQLIANLQGISLIALTFKDSGYLQTAMDDLINWINSI